MQFISTILWPIKWLVELILVAFHWLLTTLGMNPAAGLTWVLSIVGLTVIVRAALIPLFVRQIKNQRRMMEIAPQLKKIQDKYKGKKDQFSRESMSRETMELYRKTGTNPLSSCLPLLLQMPIFFSLFEVLNGAQHGTAGVGPLNLQLAKQFGSANLFGAAPLHQSFSGALNSQPVQTTAMIITAVMVIFMVASQYITQLQIVSKNMSPETKASPQFKQQRMLLYAMPLIYLFTGYTFPMGVMFYWLTSNIWTMGQQFLVIRNMPTPGSDAAKAREARLARRGKLVQPDGATVLTVTETPTPKQSTQRTQPVSKNRSKKQSGKR